MQKFSRSHQDGQIAVAILLIMTVMLTVAVSMAVRTTQEITNSSQQTESTQVFVAAESGIEEALLNGEFHPSQTTVGEFKVDNTQVRYTIQPQSTFTASVEVGQPTTVMLNNASTPEIFWAKEKSAEDRAALLIAVYYEDGDTVEYHAVGDQSVGRGDSFLQPSGVLSTEGYSFRYTVPVNSAAGPVMMRIIPVYNSTDLLVQGNLPVQQHVIESTASNENEDVNFEKRTIRVTRTLPAPASSLDYSLYASDSIIKN